MLYDGSPMVLLMGSALGFISYASFAAIACFDGVAS